MSEGIAGYRDTLNLPKTAFPMKANLVQREPALRKKWAEMEIYGRIRDLRRGCPMFVLHDGPPYANGDIHMGHVINKVLKDFVVKYKTMAGFDAPYVPGWDCHGLPIEAKVVAELGEDIERMGKLDIRHRCHKYAGKYVKIQGRQFQQLGVFGDFKNPYLTYSPAYEAGILEVFAELVDRGLVHRQLKPIHWSVECRTALAEAELDYKDIKSPSIFVNLPVRHDNIGRLVETGLIDRDTAAGAEIFLTIWTTTPWTLAANLAAAVHPELDYTAIEYDKDGRSCISIVAAERAEAVAAACGLELGKSATSTVKGKAIEGLRYEHPFVDKNPTDRDAFMVICADYVTTADGSGLVHIAPGHGLEDYASGLRHGLAVYSPVGDDGCYDDTVPAWLRGKNVLEVDGEVVEHLRRTGNLLAAGTVQHSYPHCWRSKGPVIFRATEQWFVGVDRPGGDNGASLRQMSLEAVKKVTWVPSWGQKRIEGMLQSRPDWCISRQRSWGLPIPVFLNSSGEILLSKASVLAVARHIAEKGSDSWFKDSPRDILGEDFELPEGFAWDDLHKEENIFDVWFESGCSWHSVLLKSQLPVPADLYLEGSDQHRGWFQLSLLPALGATGAAPFKTVLTHGFTVDEKGLKQSKSLGNYVNAQDEAARYGSDILRLWVASVNYQEDVRCNDELIGRMQDAYRKIRNTLRYLLGNLADFEPARHAVPPQRMLKIDRWALNCLDLLIQNVTDAYDKYLFYRVFSLVYNFCTVQMSNVYLDVLKDRLYCDGADSLSRRSAQTAIGQILDTLVRILAPVLAHTAEEAWQAMPYKSQDAQSVHLADMPRPGTGRLDQPDREVWQRVMELREDVLRKLEELRRDRLIASNLEASVTVHADRKDAALLESFGLDDFTSLCIISRAGLEQAADATTISAEKSNLPKCDRCWNLRADVGSDGNHPDLCGRCAEVVAALKKGT